MNFIKVHISKKCKGYFLVEIVVAISIFSIIMLAVIHNFMNAVTEFKKGLDAGKEDFYVNEVIRYIEVELFENTKRVEVSANTIIVQKIDHENLDNNTIHYIQLSGDKLIIKRSKYGNIIGTPNNIISNVEEFKVDQEKNLIFIALKLKGGNLVERCIGIRYNAL